MNNTNYYDDIVYYPLTNPQKRIWYTEKVYPNISLYNIGGPIRIKGNIEFNILESCINILIKKHEGLRLRLIEENGQVKQYVRNYEEVKLDYIDFSQYNNPEDEFNKWVDNEARSPFVLTNERLFYFALFKISDNDNGYLAKFHHIISDGWSINIMTDEICSSYMKLINGEKVDDTKQYSYIEYIDSENKYLSSDRFLKNKDFWNERFKSIPNTLLNKSSHIIEGKRKSFDLDADICSGIKKFAVDYKCSLNTFFVAVYLVYLNKNMRQEDIVIGTPVLNRSGKKEKGMFGMFTSTLPFRFTVDDRVSITDMMVRVNEEVKKYYYNQKYPYNLLVQDLELKKMGHDNLFNVCVNYYNTKLDSELNGYPIENVEFYNGNQIYALQLVIQEWNDSGNLKLHFDYKTYDYSDQDIENMYSQLLILMDQILLSPHEKVSDLSLLSDGDMNKLVYEFNDTNQEYPNNKVIYELFEEQVEKTPDKVAISFNNTAVTYKQLNEKANQLARSLVAKGVQEETIVGLLTTHSIESVIGILAIIKAGGAYMPIDPGYPNDRMYYMLEDSGCNLLLTNIELGEDVKFNGEIIDVGDNSLYIGDSSNLAIINTPRDLVYVIYTSGSTGKPKGTMIEHQGLVNYIWWAKKMYVKSNDELFPLYSSLAFDLTVTSIFTPLISGNQIVVYDESSDDEEYVLYRIIKDNKATIIKLTPSHLSLLKDMDNRKCSVNRFIVGGEDLKVSLAKEIYTSFDGNIEIYNEYGPTETVVGCMIHKYDFDRDLRVSVPIGGPADNVQIYILDKNRNAVPINTVGEIYIAGDGVARGYLNRPELVMEKFVDHPFVDGKRMYKTGDIARFLDDGKIEYIGRADQQTKIRGYRIELGEIENYLLNHEAIQDALVIDLEDKFNRKYLCAYIVKKLEVTTHELKDFLLRYLPDYMIPVHFVELDSITLTTNGKVNWGILPKPMDDDHTEFIKYRNEKEKRLVDTLCDVLNMDRVSIKHNFYHLGGDSIKAIQIASKINDKGCKLKVADILSNPIIEEMALYIEQRNGITVNQEPCEGSIPIAPIASWFFSHNFINPSYYNQSVLLELEQVIESNKLEIIFNELIKHHDSLRINYNSKTGELYYNHDHLDKHYSIQEHNLSELSDIDRKERMTLVAEDMKSSFNIEEDILIKACIFNLGPEEKRMLITAHHLVIDGVSWRIILDDINMLFKQINSRQEIKLPAKTNSYQEWTTALEKYCESEIYKEKNYWEQIVVKNFSFPTDYDLGENTIASVNTITVQMDEDFTERLLTKAITSYNTEPKDLLITSLLRTIKAYTGSEDIVIELEGHGRNEMLEDIDITRTVGWFTCLYPFYIKLLGNDLSDQIKAVKESIREIPNEGVGFGMLKYMSESIRESLNKYVRFNFLGDFTVGQVNNTVKLLDEHVGSDHDKHNSLTYLIEINSFIINGKLNVSLSYSSNIFSENTLNKFMNDYVMNMEAIISHCCNMDSVEFTPSDFDAVDISQGELDSLFS